MEHKAARAADELTRECVSPTATSFVFLLVNIDGDSLPPHCPLHRWLQHVLLDAINEKLTICSFDVQRIGETEGFLGAIYRVTLHVRPKQQDEARSACSGTTASKYTAIFKYAPPSSSQFYSQFFLPMRLLERELGFYRDVSPLLVSLYPLWGYCDNTITCNLACHRQPIPVWCSAAAVIWAPWHNTARQQRTSHSGRHQRWLHQSSWNRLNVSLPSPISPSLV